MSYPIDQKILDKLSAYLDGELSDADTKIVEILAEKDPEIAAELAQLSQADAAFGEAFELMLQEPVPIDLARAVESAPEIDKTPTPVAANQTTAPRYGFGSMAAGLALLVVGVGIGGYATHNFLPGSEPEIVEVAMGRGWLAEVADYHRVYAKQTRHLVEVPASEQEHLETWLANVTGVEVTTPDLSAQGWTFEGGRLLVADGKPVAQLMYTDTNGQVIALCYLQGGDETVANGRSDFGSRAFDDVSMVTWKSQSASFVVVGPSTGVDLPEIAEEIATSI